jgi:plastocyanin
MGLVKSNSDNNNSSSKKRRASILATASALIIITLATTATIAATETRYAFGQVDPQSPRGSSPAGAAPQNTVVFSKGAADRTAQHPIVPDPITVQSGSKIMFVNNDNATHTAVQGTPNTGQSGFDSGVIGPGKNATVTVNGHPNEAISYFCKIHPWLSGTIQIASTEADNGANGSSNGGVGGNAKAGAPGANNSSIDTFTVTGTIASWASGSNNTSNVISPYLLSGRWSLSVVNGTAKSFDANITMVNANGTDLHIHRLSNFKVTQESLPKTLLQNQTGSKVTSPLVIASPQSTLSIPGRIDITTDGNKTWSNLSINVMINQWHSIIVATDESATGNHFTEGHFAPGIYGIVDSVKDGSGKELLQNGKMSLP